MSPQPPTTPAPQALKKCARLRCHNQIVSGKYCSKRCSNLLWQERKRETVRMKQGKSETVLVLAVAQPGTPDRNLFCPVCGGDRAHRPVEGRVHVYACRSCQRERMTPEGARELTRVEMTQ